jgi:hypothetical protein
MDPELYRKLTDKEKETIEDIECKAKKRKHIPEFNRKWLVDYLFQGFKDFTYDSREDAVDMVKLICDLELYFAKATKKTVSETRKELMDKVNNFFPKDKMRKNHE